MNQSAQQVDRISEHGVITIANIYPAKPGKKTATIKDVDGQLFSVWPNLLPQFRPNETYEIEFTSKDVNGVTYRDIKSGRVSARPSPAPAQFTGGQSPAPRSLSSAATPEAGRNGSEKPGGSAFYRPTSPRDARRMFLCSTLNAFIQTGRIDAHRDHLKAVIVEILAAYDATVALDDQT